MGGWDHILLVENMKYLLRAVQGTKVTPVAGLLFKINIRCTQLGAGARPGRSPGQLQSSRATVRWTQQKHRNPSLTTDKTDWRLSRKL